MLTRFQNPATGIEKLLKPLPVCFIGKRGEPGGQGQGWSQKQMG